NSCQNLRRPGNDQRAFLVPRQSSGCVYQLFIGQRQQALKGLDMTAERRRRTTLLVLKIVTLFLIGVGAYLSRAVNTEPSEAINPKQPQAVSLRAIGVVHPRISPSGSDVVFSYQGSIWRMPVGPADARHGRVMKRLAAGSGFAFEPCWSPD